MDNLRKAAEDVCAVLREAGHRALFAGGCVRDMLLGAEPKDYDVATSATPIEIEALFPKTIGVGAKFGVEIVQTSSGPIEVATFRSDGPYSDGRHPDYVEFRGEREDAARRDFTINALFFDPESNEVIDYVDGRRDLEAGVIRTVGDPRERFQEDYLRLLRAVRFAARLGFALDPGTKSAVVELAPWVLGSSWERIRDEIVKLLTEGGAAQGFRLLDETGLLERILPEVAAMKGVEQPPEFHPEGDVFTHTMLMLDQLESPSPTLALGVLLHDVGKPLTQTFEDRIRFNNHDKVGARLTETICDRLRLSSDMKDRVVWMVEQHMRLGAASKMKESKLKRFVREDGFDELLELGRVDCLSSHRDQSNIEWIREFIGQLQPEEIRPARLITGNDLIAMGYEPSPAFSRILEALEDEQLEGRISTKDDAMAYIRQEWPLDE